MSDKLRVDVVGADSFRTTLNATPGFVDGEVLAASMIRQGEAPSMAGALVGHGLLKLFKPKKKDLPRSFVLVATADRVSAYKARGWGEDDTDAYWVNIQPGAVASWPRSTVSMRDAKDGIGANAVLVIEGDEVPCTAPAGNAEPAFEELQALLSSG